MEKEGKGDRGDKTTQYRGKENRLEVKEEKDVEEEWK